MFPGPQYGFGALRCAADNLNGDNVEYVFFPTGVRHVFCYALYVTPPPTAGVITIRKQVIGAPAGANPSFPFSGSISYDPAGFQLTAGGSKDFYRAGGSVWSVTEAPVAGYPLSDLSCQAQAVGGGPGASTVVVSGSTARIALRSEEHVTCTYQNTYAPPPGGLTIVKVTRGGAGRFAYVVTPLSGPGSTHRVAATTIEPGVPADAVPALTQLRPGRYEIRERQPSAVVGHWRSRQIRCGGVLSPPGQPVVVTVPSAGSVTCTFVNAFVPRGIISLDKITTGATGTASFLIAPLRGPEAEYRQGATTTVTGQPARALPDTPADATDGVRLGPYRITEQAPAGSPAGDWALRTVECNGELIPFSGEGVEVTLTTTHPSVHCVFTDAFSPAPLPPLPPVDPPPINPPPAPDPDVPGQPEYQLSDLVLTKHASAASVTRGGIVGYRITVTNRGPNPAENVMLADQPLGSAHVVSVQAGSGRCRTGATIVCSLGTLKPGAPVTVTLTLRVLDAGSVFVNRAVVGTSTEEHSLTNNTASSSVRVVAPAPQPTPPPGLG